MLRVARRLGDLHPVTVSTSLLAAHALPPEFAGRADDYIDQVCREWLPALRTSCDAVDAYCEDIAFSAAQCDRLFTAARALGLPVRLHAEQLSNVGGSQVAARHGALSATTSSTPPRHDAAALARAGTVAVMLPVAFYALAGATATADRRVAPPRRAAGRRLRLQPGLRARRLAAAGHEHGATPVRAHQRRGAARRHAARRTRARPRSKRTARSHLATRPTSPPGRSTRPTSSATGPGSIPAAWSSRTARSCSSATCEESRHDARHTTHHCLVGPRGRGRRNTGATLAPGRAAGRPRRIVPAWRCSASPATPA